MIETTIREYLINDLDIPVYMEYPTTPDEEFLVIEKTGSDLTNHIFEATVAIQSYSDSMYNAAVLNSRVVESMLSLAELDEICKCSLNSDYNFTDTSQKRYRYQAVFDITHY